MSFSKDSEDNDGVLAIERDPHCLLRIGCDSTSILVSVAIEIGGSGTCVTSVTSKFDTSADTSELLGSGLDSEDTGGDLQRLSDF